MTSQTSTLAHRYALGLSLLYLALRGLPDLFAWADLPLPGSLERHLAENPGSWLLYLFPPLPLEQFYYVPIGFQRSLNSLSTLLIETAVVFLFSAWMLKNRAWTRDGRVSAKAWFVMGAVTLLWAVVVRHLLFWFLITRQIAQFNADLPFDALPGFLWQSYWEVVPLFYLSAPLWAALPVWLHFRALGRAPDIRPDSAPAEAAPLKRACVLAGFLLGFMLLHYGLLQLLYLGFWPWAAELRDVFIPQEELEAAALPLTLSQIVMPLLAGLLAAFLYSRNAQAYRDSGWHLRARPLLAGMAALAMTNLLCLALFWLVAFADYGLLAHLVQGIGYDPEVALVLLVLFNLFSLLLLCCVTLFLRGPRVSSQGEGSGPEGAGGLLYGRL